MCGARADSQALHSPTNHVYYESPGWRPELLLRYLELVPSPLLIHIPDSRRRALGPPFFTRSLPAAHTPPQLAANLLVEYA